MVYVLNVVDGCIPSDHGDNDPGRDRGGTAIAIRSYDAGARLLYLLQRHRFDAQARPNSDGHVFAARRHFIPEPLLSLFERRARGGGATSAALCTIAPARVDVDTTQGNVAIGSRSASN